jgi:hypothetical protein
MSDYDSTSSPTYPWATNRDMVRHYFWVGVEAIDGVADLPCYLTDALALKFVDATDSRLDSWLTKVDNDINYKAMEYGLMTSQILLPLHPRIREYAEAYLCYMIFRDNIGVNNVETSQDEKYRVKFEEYRSELERTRKLLTRDIFWLNDVAIRGMNRIGGSCNMVRG